MILKIRMKHQALGGVVLCACWGSQQRYDIDSHIILQSNIEASYRLLGNSSSIFRDTKYFPGYVTPFPALANIWKLANSWVYFCANSPNDVQPASHNPTISYTYLFAVGSLPPEWDIRVLCCVQDGAPNSQIAISQSTWVVIYCWQTALHAIPNHGTTNIRDSSQPPAQLFSGLLNHELEICRSTNPQHQFSLRLALLWEQHLETESKWILGNDQENVLFPSASPFGCAKARTSGQNCDSSYDC